MASSNVILNVPDGKHDPSDTKISFVGTDVVMVAINNITADAPTSVSVQIKLRESSNWQEYVGIPLDKDNALVAFPYPMNYCRVVVVGGSDTLHCTTQGEQYR